MSTILAAGLAGYSMFQIIKWVIIIAAGVAILVIALRKFGWQVPDWLIQMCVVVAVAAVAIIALSFLASL